MYKLPILENDQNIICSEMTVAKLVFFILDLNYANFIFF